jgi:hypothetical protein
LFTGREKKTSEVMPAKHVSDAVLTYKQNVLCLVHEKTDTQNGIPSAIHKSISTKFHGKPLYVLVMSQEKQILHLKHKV